MLPDAAGDDEINGEGLDGCAGGIGRCGTGGGPLDEVSCRGCDADGGMRGCGKEIPAGGLEGEKGVVGVCGRWSGGRGRSVDDA